MINKKIKKKCFFYFKIPLLIIIKKIKLVIEWYLIKLLFLGIEAVLHNVALQLQIRTSAPPKEMELQRFKAGPSPHRRLSTEKKKIGFRQDYGWQLIFMIKTLFKNFFKIEFSYLKNSLPFFKLFFKLYVLICFQVSYFSRVCFQKSWCACWCSFHFHLSFSFVCCESYFRLSKNDENVLLFSE